MWVIDEEEYKQGYGYMIELIKTKDEDLIYVTFEYALTAGIFGGHQDFNSGVCDAYMLNYESANWKKEYQ